MANSDTRAAKALADELKILGFGVKVRSGRYQVKDKETGLHTLFAFSVRPHDSSALKNARATMRRKGLIPKT